MSRDTVKRKRVKRSPVSDVRRPKVKGEAVRAGMMVEPKRKEAGAVKPVSEKKRKPLSKRRLWLFRLMALLLPLFLLGLLEVGLRLGDVGYRTEIAAQGQVRGVRVYQNNASFGWRFFPKAISRATDPFTFPIVKKDKSYRIFVLGGSAAQGTPDGGFSFGRQLEVVLEDVYSGVDFEVVTVAMPAINSHVVLPIADEVSRYDGDLYIVYMGNNEVVGPYGAGTVFSPMVNNLGMIRAGIWAKGTRVGQLMRGLVDSVSASGQDGKPVAWQGLEMFREKQVRFDDESLGTVYDHFEQNLRDICRALKDKGGHVILSTVATNLKDCPPFASLHKDGLEEGALIQWDKLYADGQAAEEVGDWDRAVGLYEQASVIDGTYADLQYRLGQCLWAMGQQDAAKEHYLLARDYDVLRFRADKEINERIRRVDGDGGQLFDAAKAFAQVSEAGLPGKMFFHEHVHFNFQGNFFMARSLAAAVEQVLPGWVKESKAKELEDVTIQSCADALGYTPWERYKETDIMLNSYIKRAPFNGQLYQKERVAELETKLAKWKERALSEEGMKQTMGLYAYAIKGRENDWWLRWKYAEFLHDGMKDVKDAQVQYYVVTDLLPGYAVGYSRLGLTMGELGQLDSAIALQEKSIELDGINPEAYFNIGLANQLKGERDAAEDAYRKAIGCQVDFAKAYNNLAVLQQQNGDLSSGIKTLEEGLSVAGGDLDLHFHYAIFMEEAGNRSEALKHLQIASRIDPSSEKVKRVIAKVQGGGK